MPTLVNSTDFRTAFPEFADASSFPDSSFNFWADDAELTLNAERFGAHLKTAIYLYVAHFMVLSKMAARSAAIGGMSGVPSGPMSSKSVGPISKSYDTNNAVMRGAENWNQTVYGQQYYRMMRRYCLGPVYARGSGSYPRAI